MKTSTFAAGALVVACQIFGAIACDANSPPVQAPIVTPIPKTATSQGCFSSKGNMTDAQMDPTKVSTGECRQKCIDGNFYVSAVHGQQCFCGMVYPPKDSLEDDTKCNYPCPAYGCEACGSLGSPGHYSVLNLGVQLDVANYVEETTTSSSAPPSSQTSATEVQPSSPATSAPTTPTPDNGNSNNDNKSSPNVGGIVAGSVVGVLAVMGLAGGAFWFMRRRRNSEIEEEHRRNAAVNAFISGSKPPGSAGSISMTDSRLDPVMAHRRMSDGSIADNEDYSRKILRVTNA